MRTKHVIVLPYDEKWKQDFMDIKSELEAVLGKLAVSVEHVGSTSVEGLAAKPVIDIDVVVKNTDIKAAILALESMDYVHEGNLGIEGREAFSYEGKEHLRTHHLYVCPEDSPELKRHIAFRNYLRQNPNDAREYGEVKLAAAKLFPEDIDQYIEYKSPVIERIYEKVRNCKTHETGSQI